MDALDKPIPGWGDAVIQSGLTGLVSRAIRSMFGGTGGALPALPSHERRGARVRPLSDDLGWLSLTCDASGRNRHEQDVLCMGVIPDDLDIHDADGGDLSWIGLNPIAPEHPAGF